MSVVERLAEQGFIYKPTVDSPDAPFREARATRDGTVFVSGQVPILGKTDIRGALGQEGFTVERAQEAARIATFNCLSAVGTVADLEAIEQVLSLTGVVNVADHRAGEEGVGTVMNAASGLLTDVLEERGEHARMATGGVVPNGWAVDIGMVVQVEASALH